MKLQSSAHESRAGISCTVRTKYAYKVVEQCSNRLLRMPRRVSLVFRTDNVVLNSTLDSPMYFITMARSARLLLILSAVVFSAGLALPVPQGLSSAYMLLPEAYRQSSAATPSCKVGTFIETYLAALTSKTFNFLQIADTRLSCIAIFM